MSKTNSYLLENWCETIRQQQASGMKITAWCNKNNVSLKNFTRWKTKIKRLGIDLHSEAGEECSLEQVVNPLTFAEICITPSKQAAEIYGRVTVKYKGAEILVDRDSDPRVFQGVLKVLQTV